MTQQEFEQQERNGIPFFVSVASVLVDLRKYLKVA